jgi:hypothetical protein
LAFFTLGSLKQLVENLLDDLFRYQSKLVEVSNELDVVHKLVFELHLLLVVLCVELLVRHKKSIERALAVLKKGAAER